MMVSRGLVQKSDIFLLTVTGNRTDPIYKQRRKRSALWAPGPTKDPVVNFFDILNRA